MSAIKRRAIAILIVGTACVSLALSACSTEPPAGTEAGARASTATPSTGPASQSPSPSQTPPLDIPTIDPSLLEPTAPPVQPKPEPPRVVAVGDIACAPGEPTTPRTCQQQATADLTSRLDPDVVLGLGDLQYESGSAPDFKASWAKSWGRFDDILAPVPGNHEYRTKGAAGYQSYLGAPTHDVLSVGGWQIFLVDSNCAADGCAAEAAWLRSQIEAHSARCTAVTMHHPRWSSALHRSNAYLQPLWQAIVEGGVDLLLAGHDHDYERFARLDQAGQPNPEGPGTREMVVGTGGRSLYGIGKRLAGSEYAQNTGFGVLELTLKPRRYDWRYLDTADQVLDEGSDGCG